MSLRTLLLLLVLVIVVETVVECVLVASGAPWYTFWAIVPATASPAFCVGVTCGSRIERRAWVAADPMTVEELDA